MLRKPVTEIHQPLGLALRQHNTLPKLQHAYLKFATPSPGAQSQSLELSVRGIPHQLTGLLPLAFFEGLASLLCPLRQLCRLLGNNSNAIQGLGSFGRSGALPHLGVCPRGSVGGGNICRGPIGSTQTSSMETETTPTSEKGPSVAFATRTHYLHGQASTDPDVPRRNREFSAAKLTQECLSSTMGYIRSMQQAWNTSVVSIHFVTFVTGKLLSENCVATGHAQRFLHTPSTSLSAAKPLLTEFSPPSTAFRRAQPLLLLQKSLLLLHRPWQP